MSYLNVIMYCAVLPSYRSKKDDKAKGGEVFGKDVVINGDDPKNKELIAEFFGD